MRCYTLPGADTGFFIGGVMPREKNGRSNVSFIEITIAVNSTN